MNDMTKESRDGVVSYRGGAGAKTIVLVHGVNDTAASWASVAAELMRDYRVVALDLPGHGESEPKSGPLPMADMVAALARVIGDERVTLIGNSMGGWVAMLYASEHPENVEQLILEDASGMSWDLSHVPLFPKDRDEARAVFKLVQGPEANPDDATLDLFVVIAPTLPQKRVLDAGLVEWLVDARLAKLTMPVALIWGRHDGLLPLDYAHALRSRIAGARLHVIDNAAHAPHRQTPAEFLTCLRETLSPNAHA